MSFTNSPQYDTRSTVRIPLIQTETSDPSPSSGTLALNNMMINVIPKKFTNSNGEEGWQVRSRHGVAALSLPSGITTDTVRGLYVWEKSISTVYYFVVIANRIYTATSGFGPWTNVTTFTTNFTTPVRFTEFISSTNTKSLVAVDGTEGYVFTSNAAGTKITDPDFPTPHAIFPVFLNGRLYLSKASTGDIYCSDLDDPSAWTAGNFISSEVYPDDIQALVKINNYILAVGLVGSEYFYDASNATGSPLARVENQSLPFGTDFPNTTAWNLDTAVFISKTPENNTVLRIINGFKVEEIPCNFLTQVLPFAAGGTNTYKPLAHFWRDSGDLYYTINLDYTQNSDTDGSYNLVYTYCFNAKMWVQFTRGRDVNANTYGYTNGHKGYPVSFAYAGATGFNTVVAGNAYNGPFVGVLQEALRGFDTVYLNSASSTTVPFLNTVTLSNLSFGTMNRKFMYRLGIDYINESDTTGGTNVLLPRVTWWDTYGGSGTPVALTGAYVQGSSGTDFPFIYQLGSFRHRWIRVECYGMVLFRYLEVDINKGTK